MVTSNYIVESNLDDNWVMVQPQGPHTRERSPQYNEENECQERLASSSSADDGCFVDAQDNLMTQSLEGILSQKTVSHATSTSVETMTGLDMSRSMNNVTTVHPTGPTLTESTLKNYQEVLRQGDAGGILGWLAGTCTCDRYTRHFAASVPPNLQAKTGRSKPSTVSSISLEGDLSSFPPPKMNYFLGMGAWCEHK